jgi:MoxR-like ATPase
LQVFRCPPSFRVFAAQNPVREGGGRKGLPRSFLNRFTRVAVESMDTCDLEAVRSPASVRSQSAPAPKPLLSHVGSSAKLRALEPLWRSNGLTRLLRAQARMHLRRSLCKRHISHILASGFCPFPSWR